MSKLKRCVAYARVSTDKKDQANSLVNQKTYFQRELERKPDCQFIKLNYLDLCEDGVYYDKGFSGTKLHRPAFDKLLEDAGLQAIIDADDETKTTKYKVADKPKFDMIYVKDTSRFARNVVAIDVLRTLKENNVFVRFLDIGKTTENDADMTYIGIFLQFAEQESTARSEKVHFGYLEGIRKGKIYTGGNKLIGFDLDKDTNCLIVNKKEAKLVQLVFDLYTEEGLGQQAICNRLAEMGYFNMNGNKYGRSTIRRMLANEKYKGESNSGRYEYQGYSGLFTNQPKRLQDYNAEIRQQAREAQEKLRKEGTEKIPAIISVEQFEKAQRITESNRKAYNNNCTYHGTTDYARKIKCGRCGAWYTVNSRKYVPSIGDFTRYYSCSHRTHFDEENGVEKCMNPGIREDNLDRLINSPVYYRKKLENVRETLAIGDFAKRVLVEHFDRDNAEAVIEIEKQIKGLEQKRRRLLDSFLEDVIERDELSQKRAEITEQISDLAATKNRLSKGNDEIQEDIDNVEEVIAVMKKQKGELEKIIATEEYPKTQRKELLRDVEVITIDEKGTAHITFKSIHTLHTTNLILGTLIEHYSDLDEIGWEQEEELAMQGDDWQEPSAEKGKKLLNELEQKRKE